MPQLRPQTRFYQVIMSRRWIIWIFRVIQEVKWRLCNFWFLSLGLSAPSANNPFQAEVPKLTLNQMSSTSTASHGTSLPYSASSPLPMSHQAASLPSSLTHPTQPALDLPVALPEPLLPLSSLSNDGSQGGQNTQNPFLWGPIKLELNLRNKGDISREFSSSILLITNATAAPKT